MPTARPIIIEKFIDHTEIGEITLSRCSDANPVAMPAIARISGIPAASIAPKATNNMISVGRPDNSSALCSAASFIALKSAHTGHSPVTSALAPSAMVSPPTKSPSSPAASGRSLSSPICCSTGINAVNPSGEIIPASAGMASGSATDNTRGPLANSASSARSPAASSAIGVSWR